MVFVNWCLYINIYVYDKHRY